MAPEVSLGIPLGTATTPGDTHECWNARPTPGTCASRASTGTAQPRWGGEQGKQGLIKQEETVNRGGSSQPGPGDKGVSVSRENAQRFSSQQDVLVLWSHLQGTLSSLCPGHLLGAACEPLPTITSAPAVQCCPTHCCVCALGCLSALPQSGQPCPFLFHSHI